MSHKPSLLTQLSPRQIIELWGKLDPEERIQYLALLGQKMRISLSEEYKEIFRKDNEDNSLFSQFSQIFQAFNKLAKHIDRAIDSENPREIQYYLFGKEVDSLYSLLALLSKDADNSEMLPSISSWKSDLVLIYIVALSAENILKSYRFHKCRVVKKVLTIIRTHTVRLKN